jgi:hypothetical protein
MTASARYGLSVVLDRLTRELVEEGWNLEAIHDLFVLATIDALEREIDRRVNAA